MFFQDHSLYNQGQAPSFSEWLQDVKLLFINLGIASCFILSLTTFATFHSKDFCFSLQAT